jgi:hypothetical protein
MAYVITDGDEGIQINTGTRLGVLGAGLKLSGFSEVAAFLKKVLGKELRIVSSAENQWVKDQYELAGWEESNALMQQKVEALADENGLLYSGFIPFADPQELEHDIKGHMVRPQGMHLATKISFSLAGGEQVYHLGHYQVSADWVAEAKPAFVKKFLMPQIEFYQQLADRELPIVFEDEGPLDETIASANRAMLKKIGIEES